MTLKKIGWMTAVFLLFTTCKEAELESFDLQEEKSVTVATGTTTGSIIKTNESVTIPVRLKISGAASKAFEVRLRVNQEAVENLIESGELKDVVALSAGSIQIDNVAKVAYGSDFAEFMIRVTRTELEKYYGQKVAIGYSLDDATKNNLIDNTQKEGTIVINTQDLLTSEDIHYISLQNGGDIVEAQDRQNYSASSGGISIPLTANLASFPGSAFSVDLKTTTDRIATLVDAGALPNNTVALEENEFTIDKRISFPSNASEVRFALDIPWTTINNHLGELLAITIELENPTLHILNPEKNYVTVVINSDNVLEEDVTALGEFSVNRDNNSGPDSNEGSKKLVDNSVDTKFLQADFVGDLVCTLVFEEAQKIGAYTLSSANDADTRDPKDWNLQGSNDGINWTTIDSRSDEMFTGRKITRRFNVAYPEAYTHYRLNITAIKGGTNLFQLAEWRIIKVR